MTEAPSTPTIVVGFIPNPQGQAALEHAVAEAKLRGGRLLIVNAAGTDAFADERRAGEEDLAGLHDTLATTGVEYDVRQTGSDQNAADTLVSVAEETGAALIVIGLRQRSLVGKLLMGSNAQRILLDAPCPVLSVKASPRP
jgi:nucleotide-binding universal stress UspA family protein